MKKVITARENTEQGFWFVTIELSQANHTLLRGLLELNVFGPEFLDHVHRKNRLLC
jgi:hypothetical protein